MKSYGYKGSKYEDWSDKELLKKISICFQKLEKDWVKYWQINTDKKWCENYEYTLNSTYNLNKNIENAEDNINIILNILSKRHIRPRWYHTFINGNIRLKSYVNDKHNVSKYYILFPDDEIRGSRFYYCFANMIEGLNDETEHIRVSVDGFDLKYYDYNFGVEIQGTKGL